HVLCQAQRLVDGFGGRHATPDGRLVEDAQQYHDRDYRGWRPPRLAWVGPVLYTTSAAARRPAGRVGASVRSSAVRFGYYILNTYVPELDGAAADLYGRYFEQIEAAEAVGFDAVWATEHHFRYFGGMTPNPQMLLTAISARTRRLRLGSSVSILPLHNPLRIAEDFAMLDVLSGGRLEFGAGRGMVHSGYRGFGLRWDDAQDHMKE